ARGGPRESASRARGNPAAAAPRGPVPRARRLPSRAGAPVQPAGDRTRGRVGEPSPRAPGARSPASRVRAHLVRTGLAREAVDVRGARAALRDRTPARARLVVATRA